MNDPHPNLPELQKQHVFKDRRLTHEQICSHSRLDSILYLKLDYYLISLEKNFDIPDFFCVFVDELLLLLECRSAI